jgi:large subunit ribosomal protein L17
VQKLFNEIAPRFKDRNGGYTRVVKFGFRRGDAAPLSIIEFTGAEEQTKGKKPRKRAAKKTEGQPQERQQRAAAR